MNTIPVVGLKGFSRWGRIDQYFSEGLFPQKANWRAADYVPIAYQIARGSRDNFVLVCFSDGGTIAHDIAASVGKCIGLIAHSATFNPPHFVPRIPVLLLSTEWDLTRMSWETDRAEAWYQSVGVAVTRHRLPRTTWHGHEFSNGLLQMNAWSLEHFGKALPLA